ncbi:hypothetical protein TNCV_809901 [Trichonephila clavipes]|uniref:Uncharacterized protein n=1 Tax=Trichonephila clavipes TaxID=2585209 RepID=A0A8X6V884_TRICX|nr:hypothetical protein TNCV_809901 [Trichonephila clavipes]
MTKKRYTSSMESDETIQLGAKTLKKGSQSRTEKLRAESTKTGSRMSDWLLKLDGTRATARQRLYPEWAK